jgi:predicted short-subunit dehydrogenase-like oxidoreductase (DUF2520 family)
LAAGGVVSVATLAERLMSLVGVERAHLVPLVRSAVDNWAVAGADALTGPVVRGDVATTATQREAVAGADPSALALWDALDAEMRRLAASRDDSVRS